MQNSSPHLETPSEIPPDAAGQASTAAEPRWKARIKQILPYALAATAFWFLLRPEASGPTVGTLAPDFSLPVVVGTQAPQAFQLAAQRGKPVLIEVFASWCGVCKGVARTVAEVATAPRSGPVRFVGISIDDDVDATRDAAKAWGIPYDVIQDDGHFASAYTIRAVPTFILVDAEGKIRRVASGSVSQSKLDSWLDEVGASRTKK